MGKELGTPGEGLNCVLDGLGGGALDARSVALIVFLGITVLTAIAVLAAAVGWLPDSDPRLVTWGIPAVIGEIVATVVIYVKSPGQSIRVNLLLTPADIELDERVNFKVLDNSGNERKKGTVVPIRGPGGYQVTIPADVAPTDSIALSFQERTGAAWGVPPFLPYVQNREAIRTTDGQVDP